MTNKPILAIETSGELCSTAVMLTETTYFEFTIKRKHVHSEMLMTMISDLLMYSGIELNECGAIAVSNGPGSFTGLRIGMSAAKGLALGAQLPIAQVPTFNALALQVSDNLNDGEQFVLANNANVSELYYAKFVKVKNNYDIIDEVSLITKDKFEEFDLTDTKIFGDYIKNENALASPNAVSLAKWTYLFGKDLLTYNYEYIEPNYLKKFVAKEKK